MTEIRNIEADLARFRTRVFAVSVLVLVCFLLLTARLVYLQADDGRHVAVPSKFFRQEGNNFWKFTETSLLNAQVMPAAGLTHPVGE